jgi:hypothetical protein
MVHTLRAVCEQPNGRVCVKDAGKGRRRQYSAWTAISLLRHLPGLRSWSLPQTVIAMMMAIAEAGNVASPPGALCRQGKWALEGGEIE